MLVLTLGKPESVQAREVRRIGVFDERTRTHDTFLGWRLGSKLFGYVFCARDVK